METTCISCSTSASVGVDGGEFTLKLLDTLKTLNSDSNVEILYGSLIVIHVSCVTCMFFGL